MSNTLTLYSIASRVLLSGILERSESPIASHIPLSCSLLRQQYRLKPFTEENISEGFRALKFLNVQSLKLPIQLQKEFPVGTSVCLTSRGSKN